MIKIEDIIETPEKAPILLGWQWVLLAIFCILVICLIISLLKNKKKSNSSINHLSKALNRLKAIEQVILEKKLDSNHLIIELSLITREYLQGQFRNQSIFQTHQEFISDHQDLEKIPAQARENLASYLTTLANHKYSPNNQLPTEINKLIQHTESLLTGIHAINPDLKSDKSS